MAIPVTTHALPSPTIWYSKPSLIGSLFTKGVHTTLGGSVAEIFWTTHFSPDLENAVPWMSWDWTEYG